MRICVKLNLRLKEIYKSGQSVIPHNAAFIITRNHPRRVWQTQTGCLIKNFIY